MPFAAALSTDATTSAAVADVCDRVRADLPGQPDLTLAFFTPHHEAAGIAQEVASRLAPRAALGCIAEAVIGGGREIELQPAVSLWAARWPRPVRLTPFHLTLERTADGPSLLGWPDALGGEGGREAFAPARSAVLLLGDPFSFPTEAFLARVNEEAPGLPVLGGMASGIRGTGQARLVQDGEVRTRGAVGLMLEGDLGLRWIVSQGCRPIGQHMVVTKAEDNVIQELGGLTPFEQLRRLWDTLSADEQRLFQQGLHIGRVLNEYRGEFQRGDFLVRNVVGLERDSGALVITDHVRVGQTVQFHVRDAASADEDLHALLQLDLNAHERRPAGGLVFSCNGRGTRLFGAPDHDAAAVRQEAGPIPLAGFFAMGELGPVGGQNFIHGFTASVALFEE
ncbi:MAG: FIST N-terminal domain-containing protein [Gemmataceae bacterium]